MKQNLFEAMLQPGITFIEHAHDNDCPGAHGDPKNCVCKPDITIHRDEKRFIRTEVQNRRQRRAAARAAAKALKKAGGRR